MQSYPADWVLLEFLLSLSLAQFSGSLPLATRLSRRPPEVYSENFAIVSRVRFLSLHMWGYRDDFKFALAGWI